MKMTGFRSRQPLSDDDFAAIRRNVMATIAARRERRFLPIVMRFAFAAAVVIAFIAHRPATTPVVVKKQALVVEIAHAAPTPALMAPPAITPVAHRPKHRTTRHPQYQDIRVEFRTSDPDVRIIWIASQTQTTTGGKS
jgi:hypothetical protein